MNNVECQTVQTKGEGVNYVLRCASEMTGRKRQTKKKFDTYIKFFNLMRILTNVLLLS